MLVLLASPSSRDAHQEDTFRFHENLLPSVYMKKRDYRQSILATLFINSPLFENAVQTFVYEV